MPPASVAPPPASVAPPPSFVAPPLPLIYWNKSQSAGAKQRCDPTASARCRSGGIGPADRQTPTDTDKHRLEENRGIRKGRFLPGRRGLVIGPAVSRRSARTRL
ncbi:hypothetical protein EYF80_030059 [Liparis tanakae]|uniref:Uncharacterized protein n=1 Tax=Liparis tanakae TaxID=230148 RepID=A0A4Z2H1F8_9TELE|nr:hypothetical protein EYF80_030059 [Liparis tanakae]